MQRILSVDRISPVLEIKKVYPYDRRNKYRVRYDQWKGTDPEYCVDPIERHDRQVDNIVYGSMDKALENCLIDSFIKDPIGPKTSYVDFNNKVRIV